MTNLCVSARLHRRLNIPFKSAVYCASLSIGLAIIVALLANRAEAQSPARSASARPIEPGRSVLGELAMATESPFPKRIKSPSLEGGTAWINTAGDLELEQLRGKFVLLDFWTYCCINCMHILPELKKIEQKFPNELVVIGVHSAKFVGEADSQNITEAVLRNEIQHPVVNDAKRAIWSRFGVDTWPTLVLIDPEGYVVWGRSGETTADVLEVVLTRGLAYYRRRGVVDSTPLRFELAEFKAQETPLRYPGKLLADAASDRLFIADSNHNRIVITRLDGTLLDTIGNGQEGRADGDYTLAEFHHPQGLALNGETLYVADTENHSLRKIDLQSRRVKTIAGRGAQARHNWPGVNIEDGRPASSANLPKRYVSKPSVTALNSPWDLWIHGHDLYIAMAGPHQIWKMPLDESEIGPYAGNGREDIVDGPLLPHIPYQEGFASFAQPSGLTADDRWLYVADSEGSSIRAVPFDPKKKVHTIIGTAGLSSNRLFTFGDVDGRSGSVRLQHALGVAYHDGLLYVADTYNNKVKVIDPKELTSNTLAGSGQAGRDDGPSGEPLTATFDEPAGISIAGETIYLADTNSHAIRTIDLAHGNRVGTLNIPGLSPPKRVEKEPTLTASKIHKVATATVRPEAGQVTLHISLHLPEGWKINPLAPMQYRVEALDKTLFEKNALGQSVKLSEPKTEFDINLPVTASAGHDRLRVTLQYFYCQEAAVGLCKAGSVMWELPITVSADATTSQTSLTWKVD